MKTSDINKYANFVYIFGTGIYKQFLYLRKFQIFTGMAWTMPHGT